MTLRRRTLLVISLTLVALLMTLFVIAQAVLQRGFAELERNDAFQNVNRVQRALQNEIANLNTVALDYSDWDDTYAFAAGQNPDYVAMMDTSTLANLRLNAFAVTDATGQEVLTVGIDPVTQEDAPVSSELQPC